MKNSSVKILVLGLVAIAAAILSARPAMACAVPDPNFVVGTDPNGMVQSVTISARTFPGADPNTNTCACGLNLPAGATTSGVQVLDLDGNPIPEFLGFSSNPDTTSAFDSLQNAKPGTAWSGFNTMVAPSIPVGRALLRFDVSAPGMTGTQLKLELLSDGLAGAALADLSGVNFDPSHTAIVDLGGAQVPTLSEWGMIMLAAFILLGGIAMVMRRRRQAQIV